MNFLPNVAETQVGCSPDNFLQKYLYFVKKRCIFARV